MSQDDFTSDAYARKDDLDTSHRAADKVRVTNYEQLVLEALLKRGPGNGHEIAYDTGLALNAVTPRFAPLRKKGLITFALDEDGKRIKRKAQHVWKAVEAKETND